MNRLSSQRVVECGEPDQRRFVVVGVQRVDTPMGDEQPNSGVLWAGRPAPRQPGRWWAPWTATAPRRSGLPAGPRGRQLGRAPQRCPAVRLETACWCTPTKRPAGHGYPAADRPEGRSRAWLPRIDRLSVARADCVRRRHRRLRRIRRPHRRPALLVQRLRHGGQQNIAAGRHRRESDASCRAASRQCAGIASHPS